MKIEDLNSGDFIYDIFDCKVRIYRFLCVHPMNEKYFILINELGDPFKIHEEHLIGILNKCLKNKDQAMLLLANMLIKDAEQIKHSVLSRNN